MERGRSVNRATEVRTGKSTPAAPSSSGEARPAAEQARLPLFVRRHVTWEGSIETSPPPRHKQLVEEREPPPLASSAPAAGCGSLQTASLGGNRGGRGNVWHYRRRRPRSFPSAATTAVRFNPFVCFALPSNTSSCADWPARPLSQKPMKKEKGQVTGGGGSEKCSKQRGRGEISKSHSGSGGEGGRRSAGTIICEVRERRRHVTEGGPNEHTL